MEATSRSLGPVVIGQDEQTELHIQAILQSGRRELDIRIWRRGPAGFAPSRSALTVEADDLAVLIGGIDQLLAESDGASKVARVICDKDDSRRLRAETEPFGTHFMARLGFWQRIRDSWRPVGDGLQLDANQLAPLRRSLETLSPHLVTLTEPRDEMPEAGFENAAIYRWPSPGRDWLTVEGDQLTFHPRGVRITASLTHESGQPSVVLQQWRHEDRLWLPCDVSCSFDIRDLQTLLWCIRASRERRGETLENAAEIGTMSSGELTVLLTPDATLEIAKRPDGEDLVSLVSLPTEFAPHFGRLLVEAGNLLLGAMSKEERDDLLNREDVAVSEEIVSEALLTKEDEREVSDNSTRDEPVSRPKFATAEELVAQVLRKEEEEQAPVAEEPLVEEPPEEDVRRLAPLGEVRLGRHSVYLYDLREDQQRFMSLQWDGRTLNLPLDTVPQMVEDLRQMYYQALRGRRGQGSSIGLSPVIRMAVHHQGSSTQVVLEHEEHGEKTSILFPVTEVPAFLNATETALVRSSREPQIDEK